jgi:hypothetical protein
VSFRLVGIGEVLWDLLPEGPKLGGAPANFAYHAKALGAECSLVTRIGDDELGRAILRRCDEAGFAQETIQIDDIALTGTVSVSLSSGGVPSYVIHENVAWDRLTVTAPALDAVRRADAISFGSLAQRSDNSRQSIRTLVAAAPRHALRVFDINLRQNYFSRDVIHQSLGLAKCAQDERCRAASIGADVQRVRVDPAADGDCCAGIRSASGRADPWIRRQPAASRRRMVRLSLGRYDGCGYNRRRRRVYGCIYPRNALPNAALSSQFARQRSRVSRVRRGRSDAAIAKALFAAIQGSVSPRRCQVD